MGEGRRTSNSGIKGNWKKSLNYSVKYKKFCMLLFMLLGLPSILLLVHATKHILIKTYIIASSFFFDYAYMQNQICTLKNSFITLGKKVICRE